MFIRNYRLDQFFSRHSRCMHTTYTICFKSYKDKIDGFHNGFFCVPRALAIKAWGGKDKLVRCIENDKCWLKELGGIEYVEWKVEVDEQVVINRKMVFVRPLGQKEHQFESVVAAMFDDAKLDWNSVGCNDIEENGMLAGELNRRLSKAVEAMEKALGWSRYRFKRLRSMSDAGKLSSEGTEAMRTLGENIKARLCRAHPYIMCCNTHRCNFNLFMITSDHHSPKPRHTLGS